MIAQPVWYRKTEAFLAPSWPLMLLASAVVIGITVALVINHKAIPLAAWLTYLFMP